MTVQILRTTRTWTTGRVITAVTVVLALVSVALLSACGGGADEWTACTTQAVGSIGVTPVDAQGRALTGVEIRYRLNGEPQVVVTCDTSCQVGTEQSGSFELTANKAGYATATATVRVERGVCHVIQEQWRPTLRQL